MLLSLLTLSACAPHSGAALSGAPATVDIELQYAKSPGSRVRQRVLVDGVALASVPEEVAVEGAHRDVFRGKLPAGEHELEVMVRFFDDTTPEPESATVVGAGMVGPAGAAVPILTVIPGEEAEPAQRTAARCEVEERVAVESGGRYLLRFTFAGDGVCALRFEPVAP